jgi:hypothetical protein
MNQDVNNEGEWLGIALYQGEIFLITGILAEFILDYRAYDPEYSSSRESSGFRGGVLTLTPNNISQFLSMLNARALTMTEMESLANSATDGSELLAFIDFDSQQYVHSYYDLALEEYIPQGWHGVLGNPRQKLKEVYSMRLSE